MTQTYMPLTSAALKPLFQFIPVMGAGNLDQFTSSSANIMILIKNGLCCTTGLLSMALNTVVKENSSRR